MYKTGITKINNEWTPWVKIGQRIFNLQGKTIYDDAEFLLMSFEHAIEDLQELAFKVGYKIRPVMDKRKEENNG